MRMNTLAPRFERSLPLTIRPRSTTGLIRADGRRALRIATYNLLHGIDVGTGRIDLGAAAAAIDGLGADVVAVQEVDRGLERTGAVDQVAVLADRLGWHGAFAPALYGSPASSWTTPDGDDSGEPAFGVGILSRFPLSAVASRRLPGGRDGERRWSGSTWNPGWDAEPRAALRATVSADGVTLSVTTTHLSYLPWRGVAQLRAAASFATAVTGPAALIGDLNLPAWATRAALAGTPLQHAGGAPTYPAWRPRVQIDQLLHTQALRATDVQVGPRGPSDHLPLVARLEPRDPRPSGSRSRESGMSDR
jgi:endonuclease/exonuclease/phosphatase family metal-dependent hydrolase